MPLYTPIWPDIPGQQYKSLSPEMRREFDVTFALILDDPKGLGSYDKGSVDVLPALTDGEDVKHLADAMGIDFDSALATAGRNHRAEFRGEF